MTCHCQSKLTFEECCKPIHDNHALATTAEMLMRSRYSAFVLANVDYIVQTTVPSQQPLLDTKAIEDWAKSTNWSGLEVIHHTAKLGKRHAQVEFKAFFMNKLSNEQEYHHELSTFVSINNRWYFIDPNALAKMSMSQKQPCLCGSNDKFKHCCGKFNHYIIAK